MGRVGCCTPTCSGTCGGPTSMSRERNWSLDVKRDAVKRRLIGVDPWTLQQNKNPTKKRALGLLWIKFHKPAVRAGPEWTLSPTIPLFYQYNCVLHLGPLMLERRSFSDERWRSWRLFKGDKVVDCKTREQNNAHSTTELRRLVLSAQRARGKTVTHIQRENQAVLHHARRYWWVCLSARRVCRCDSAATFSYSFSLMPPPPITDSGTGCEPFETRGQRALLFTQSFFPDRDGRLNKFSTYAHHMEMLIYFFSTATLKCEPTPKPLYITFNF